MNKFDFIYVDDSTIQAKDSDFALCSYFWRDEVWMPHKHCKEIPNAIVLTEQELKDLLGLAEDGYKLGIQNAAHQEFLKEDQELISRCKNLLKNS